MLSAVNLGVSVAGFAVVITQLNQISDQIRQIEAKVDRLSVKLDDQALAKLKAGVNACLMRRPA
jgi:outer membrane murein-binding lipoprotein Lpp